MIGRLNHIAIAVPNLMSAAKVYKQILVAKVSDPIKLPIHGVKPYLSNYLIPKLNYYIPWEKILR